MPQVPSRACRGRASACAKRGLSRLLREEGAPNFDQRRITSRHVGRWFSLAAWSSAANSAPAIHTPSRPRGIRQASRTRASSVTWHTARRALWLAVCFACAPSAKSTVIGFAPRRYGPDRHFLVYTGAKVLRWHSVVVSRDSVSGISDSLRAVACDTCRQSLSQTDVDSIAMVQRSGGTPPTLLQVVLVLLVAGGALLVH